MHEFRKNKKKYITATKKIKKVHTRHSGF